MATAEAIRAAKSRYRKKAAQSGKLKVIRLEFYESELDLYEHVKENGPMATYLKQLVRKDMERKEAR